MRKIQLHNLILFFLLAGLVLNALGREESIKQRFNIILITIDSFRPDHLGCYGYERDTSPHIDAFTEECALFKNCYSPASWTIPALASMFSSLHPSMHNATMHGSVLPEGITTLVEVMQKAGYITYAFTANAGLQHIFNSNRDGSFDFFDDHLLSNTTYEETLRCLLLFRYVIAGIIEKELGSFEGNDIRHTSAKARRCTVAYGSH